MSVRLFVFHHECGHHNVGESELDADCWAVDRGVRDGWLDAKGLDAVCRSFEDAPETDTHPSGRRRCRNLDRCFATAVASLPAKKSASVVAPASPAKTSLPPRLVGGPTLVGTGTLRFSDAASCAPTKDPIGMLITRRSATPNGCRDSRPRAHWRGVAASVRQFEPVALGALLAARRLGCLRVALAAHARKDDDLCTRCFGTVARLSVRVPRTEIENHGHCVPLAKAMCPGLPHRTTRTRVP